MGNADGNGYGGGSRGFRLSGAPFGGGPGTLTGNYRFEQPSTGNGLQGSGGDGANNSEDYGDGDMD